MRGEKQLRKRVEEAFNFALQQTKNQPKLSSLYQQLFACKADLNEPMRIAVVGLIKAGKSTMVNALLEESVLATGTVEATFNVNWLKYGEKKTLKVYFKDNRKEQEKSFEELEELTRRADENKDYLLSIKYIEVFYPNVLLKNFNIIDTPGLASYHKDDSENTTNFLKLYGNELSERTRAEASNADAVLYLFQQGLSAMDESIAKIFQGSEIGQPTPINAIGVLTRIDGYWSDEYPNPMDAGRKVSGRLCEDPKVRNLFYTICPVSGFLALGAKTIKFDEFDTLRKLANLPEDRLNRLLLNVTRFNEREYEDIAISPIDRRKVMERLGQYGVSLACQIIREKLKEEIIPQEELYQLVSNGLFNKSGVPELSHLVTAHFGNRAFLIKLNSVLKKISTTCFRELQKLSSESDRQIVDEIAGQFGAIKDQEHAFRELEALRAYYEGKLEFTDEEVTQLLQVTGEYGISCGDRLGLSERALISEMFLVAQYRLLYWQKRASDVFSANRQTVFAANVLVRSFERIIFNLRKVEEYLYI